jgi:hypothetical protein
MYSLFQLRVCTHLYMCSASQVGWKMFETVEVQDTVGGPFKSRTKLNTYTGTMAKLAEHLCDLLRGHKMPADKCTCVYGLKPQGDLLVPHYHTDADQAPPPPPTWGQPPTQPPPPLPTTGTHTRLPTAEPGTAAEPETLSTQVGHDSDNEDDDGSGTSRCACFIELHLERATAVISFVITCFQSLFQFTTSSSCIYFANSCMVH